MLLIVASTLLYLITSALQRQGEQIIPEDSVPGVALATLIGRALPLAETLMRNWALLSHQRFYSTLPKITQIYPASLQ